MDLSRVGVSFPAFAHHCHFCRSDLISDTIDQKGWIEILALSHRCGHQLQKICIDVLGNMPIKPIERIKLCERYDIDFTWAAQAILDTCTSPSLPLTENLSAPTLLLLMQVRQVRENSLQQEVDAWRQHSCSHARRSEQSHKGRKFTLPGCSFCGRRYYGRDVTLSQVLDIIVPVAGVAGQWVDNPGPVDWASPATAMGGANDTAGAYDANY